MGDSRKIEFAAKKGKGNNDHMVAVMYKFNKWLYDIQLLSGINQEDWIIGVGWAGNLDNWVLKVSCPILFLMKLTLILKMY